MTVGAVWPGLASYRLYKTFCCPKELRSIESVVSQAVRSERVQLQRFGRKDGSSRKA